MSDTMSRRPTAPHPPASNIGDSSGGALTTITSAEVEETLEAAGATARTTAQSSRSPTASLIPTTTSNFTPETVFVEPPLPLSTSNIGFGGCSSSSISSSSNTSSSSNLPARASPSSEGAGILERDDWLSCPLCPFQLLGPPLRFNSFPNLLGHLACYHFRGDLLALHRRQGTSAFVFGCSLCGQDASTEGLLVLHLARHHLKVLDLLPPVVRDDFLRLGDRVQPRCREYIKQLASSDSGGNGGN